ncbi:MAG: hypothetical protein KAV25_04980 [Methanophagales archaeon]|nr:hypothetical protein [Methanophagales archaeon]
MKEENKLGREELKKLAKESTGALSWIILSEPLEKRLEIVKLVGKALDTESKVLYEEAELC